MQRMMLFLWLLGGAIYAGFSLVPPPKQTVSVDASSQPDKTTRSSDVPGDPPAADRVDQLAPSGSGMSRRVQDAEVPAAKPEIPRTEQPEEELQPTDTDPPFESSPDDTSGDGALAFAHGRLARAAPVHSGPSIDTSVIGYANEGAAVEMVERRAGYLRVIDPSSGKDGWIHEDYVVGSDSPYDRDQPWGSAPTEEASVAPWEDEAFSQSPQQRAVKAKKGKKKLGRKGKGLKFGLRLRRR